MNKGVTLIELLLAVVLMSIVGVSMSLLFPKSFQSTIFNRQRLTASQLAASKMDEIKSLPYPLIPRTNAGAGYFGAGGVADPGCDCKTVDWSGMPLGATLYNNGNQVSDTVVNDGVTYTRYVCINLAERPAAVWIPRCPAIDENAATLSSICGKNIRVHVTWSSSNETKSVDMESLATRF